MHRLDLLMRNVELASTNTRASSPETVNGTIHADTECSHHGHIQVPASPSHGR